MFSSYDVDIEAVAKQEEKFKQLHWMTSETELEMQAVENTKICNEGHRCPDGYSFWVCPFEGSKCQLVGLEDWENALAAKAREEKDDG